MNQVVIVLLMAAVNLLVGACVGLTGIAGFLLPMFYSGFLGMPAVESLALSFAAFLVSGIFGSVNYHKSGNLDLRTAAVLSAGSFLGAIGGVKINLLIPEETMKVILYVVVLASGVSILLRKEKAGKGAEKEAEKEAGEKAREKAGEIEEEIAREIAGEIAEETGAGQNGEEKPGKKSQEKSQEKSREKGQEKSREKQQEKRRKQKEILSYLLLGVVTGAICAASGAGGPVLVMPLLTLIGFPAHTAVGISLFDSIFIALPAVAGYLYHAASNRNILYLLPVLLIAHAVGVIFGSKNAVKINQKLLKRIVAVASIAIACMKLIC